MNIQLELRAEMNRLLTFIKQFISYNLIFRVFAMAGSFLLIRFVLGYLGPKEYGLWITITSISSWIINFDMGLGNGLRNKVSEKLALGETQEAKTYISTAYAQITLISIVFLIISIGVINSLNWATILSENSFSSEYIAKIVIFMFIITLSNFVLNLYRNIYYAINKSNIAGLSYFIYQSIYLFLVLVLYYTNQENANIQHVVIVYGLSNLITSLIFTGSLFLKNKEITPDFKSFSIRKSRSLLATGSDFFVIQLSMIIIYTSDNLIISHFIGLESVTQYSVTLKLFQLFIYLFGFILVPYWGIYNKAFTTNKINIIKGGIEKLNKLFYVFVILIIITIISSRLIFSIWIGELYDHKFILIISMGIFAVVKIYADIYATVLNGIGETKIQKWIMVLGAIGNIPLSILLINVGLGNSGVIVASSISLLPYVVIIPKYTIKILKEKEDVVNRQV